MQNRFIKSGFRKALKRATAKNRSKIVNPKLVFEDVWDKYTLYVLVFHISETVFWEEDIRNVEKVALNKIAYDGWSANPRERG